MCELLVPMEVQKLQAALNAKEEVIQDRERKIAALVIAVASLSRRTIAPQRSEVDANVKLHTQKLEHRNKELVATCDKLRVRVETLSVENESFARDNSSLVRLLEKEKQNKVKAFADLQQMTIESESLVKKHKLFSKEHRSLSDANRKLQEDSEKVKSFQRVLTKANAHLTQHNTQLQQERDDLAGEVAQMRQQMNNLQVQKEQLVREVGRLHAAASGKSHTPNTTGCSTADVAGRVQSPDMLKIENSSSLQALTMPLSSRDPTASRVTSSLALPNISVQPSRDQSNISPPHQPLNRQQSGGQSGNVHTNGVPSNERDSSPGTVPGRLDLLTATLKALNHSSNSQCQHCKDLMGLLNTTQQQYQQQHQQYQQSETFFRRVLEEQLKTVMAQTLLITRRLDDKLNNLRGEVPTPGVNVEALKSEVEKLRKKKDEMDLKGQGLAAEALALRQQLYHAQSKHDELEDGFRRVVAEMLVQAKRVKAKHDELLHEDYEMTTQFADATERVGSPKESPVMLLKSIKGLEQRMTENLMEALMSRKRAAAEELDHSTSMQDVAGQHAPKLPPSFKKPKNSM